MRARPLRLIDPKTGCNCCCGRLVVLESALSNPERNSVDKGDGGKLGRGEESIGSSSGSACTVRRDCSSRMDACLRLSGEVGADSVEDDDGDGGRGIAKGASSEIGVHGDCGEEGEEGRCSVAGSVIERLMGNAGEFSGVMEYRLPGELTVLPSSIIDSPATLYKESALGGGDIRDSNEGLESPPALVCALAPALEGGVARLALLISALTDTDDLFDFFLITTVACRGRGGGTS